MSEPLDPQFRCGTVSIVGRPNVGKSTLLNAIVGEKVAIVSKVPQTTRSRVRGIYTDERGQIIFIDTPGLYLGKDKLDKLLTKISFRTLDEVDCVIHVVDTSEPVGMEEEAVVERLKRIKYPIILGLNKIDLKGKYLPQYIRLWEKAKNQPIEHLKDFTLLPLAGRNKTNIEKLIDILMDILPQGPALYPLDIISDVPQRIVIGDIIREKLLALLRDELPHSVAVKVEAITPKRGKVLFIQANIFVERDSQKEIVIGKGGTVLKKVGILARAELEELLESKVYLDLYVKLEEKWRDNSGFLMDLGYEI